MNALISLDEARRILKNGGVIAYPTEAVYGLGCDAFNESAVYRILSLKNRSVSKGLIILIHDWTQLFSLVAPISVEHMDKVRDTWPGPVTWIFPSSPNIPACLSGEHGSIAIRMSDHPIAQALCIDGPIVSTSANRSGQESLRDHQSVQAQFIDEIDGIVTGNIGLEAKPSIILDVLSGKQFR